MKPSKKLGEVIVLSGKYGKPGLFQQAFEPQGKIANCKSSAKTH